jgi:prolyl 4-hydroxylase
MSGVVRVAPVLGTWIQQNLRRGEAPAALVAAMREQAMPPDAARAVVDAFARALLSGAPLPVDSVEVPAPAQPAEAATPDFTYQTPRLAQGTAIEAGDRLVRVAARAQRPMLAVFNNVLDATECEELIEMARGRLRPSTVVDPKTGRDVPVDWRASQGMFFRPLENPFIERLDRRIAALMNLPVTHGEGLQVLHYPCGAGSAPHFDFLVPSNDANRASIARSGQRVSTLVTYLNDVPAGGQTLFQAAGWAVSPQRGNAVYFEYCNGLGQVDHASLHSSSAVEEGEKWVATKWMRARPFVSGG